MVAAVLRLAPHGRLRRCALDRARRLFDRSGRRRAEVGGAAARRHLRVGLNKKTETEEGIMGVSLKIAFTALALGAGLIAAPALAEDPVKIAVVTHGQSSDTYWGVVKKGVDDAAKL